MKKIMERHTYCRFCLGSCGLILKTKDGIVKVRGDKKNPHSKGIFVEKDQILNVFMEIMKDGSRSSAI